MGHIHERQLVAQLGWSSGALKEGARPGQGSQSPDRSPSGSVGRTKELAGVNVLYKL